MYILEYKDTKLKINTSEGLFSPNGADKGTLFMLEHTTFEKEDILLDLGCGTGIVSLCAAVDGVLPENITLTDIKQKNFIRKTAIKQNKHKEKRGNDAKKKNHNTFVIKTELSQEEINILCNSLNEYL